MLDEQYDADDNEIGKNLLSVHIEDSTEAGDRILIRLKSMILTDESYNIQTL